MKCDSCDEIFPGKHNLGKHMDSVHRGIVPHITLNEHSDSVHEGKKSFKFKCTTCLAVFSSKRKAAVLRNIRYEQ